jgi:recombination protein RecR
MLYTSESLEILIEEFSKLPGIGRKSAQRISLYLLKQPKENIEKFARAMIDIKDKILSCSNCCNITETDPCPICSNTKRDRSILCIVEEPNDVIAIEKTNGFHGLYHVLGGSLSPLDGIGPEDLKVKELLMRFSTERGKSAEPITEIIIAMNPNVEGEATTIYLSKLLKPFELKVTRIARGLPIGGDMEFADEATLARAIEGRIPI